MQKITAKSVTRSFHQHPYAWLLALLLTFVPSIYLSFKLDVRSDFKRLLPQDKPSVVELDRIIAHIGGIGNLTVAIECDDSSATKRFIEDLVARIQKLPAQYVRYVDYTVKDAREFYTKNKYLYLDLEDLKEIHNRLAKKIRFEKLRQNPLFIALEEDEVDFDLSDIEAKYKNKTNKYDAFQDGYFFGENGKIAAILIKPFGSSTSTGFAKDLIGRVQTMVDSLDPTSYHPTLKVALTGKYQSVLDEYAQLLRDVLETLGLCIALVALVIYLYFLRVRAIFLLTAPLLLGVAWTFALTQIQIGYLNSQTAFLGSIIIGNGVNYGIILLARYMEERRQKQSVESSLQTALETTWLGTLTSAMTTSAAFAALSFSQIKSFSQFGFIGGFGMTLCWVATYLALPPLLVITERMLPSVKENEKSSNHWEFLLTPIGNLVAYSPRIIAAFGLFLSIGFMFVTVRYLPHSLEYDFSKLRNKPRSELDHTSLKARAEDSIFGGNLSPVVVLLDREEQAKYLCDDVLQMEANLPESEKNIDSCKTLQSYLPDKQKEKLHVLAKTRLLLEDRTLNFASDKYKKEIVEFRKAVNLRELSLQDLPISIKRHFQELDNRLGRIAYIYRRPDVSMSNGQRLMRFSDTLANVRLKDGSVVHMSGESFIFSDLFRAVLSDGPIATVLSFLGVALAVWITIRRRRPVFFIVGGLAIGVIYMLGLQAILNIKLNFFNFIALPVTFGIGVDYGVNLLQRYRFEGRGSVRRVLGTVGGAILLCSLTTLISYLTLLTAQNQALASFGWLGLIGELACLFAAIVIMPAVLHSFDRPLEEKTKSVPLERRQGQ